MVDISLLQSLSYVAAAIGVCVAAFYYVSMLRNAEKDRRRQTIMQKLPPINKEYYLDIHILDWMDFESPEEFNEKYGGDLENSAKVWNMLYTYNVLGTLYKEGLMSLEDVANMYSPRFLVRMYEKFEFVIMRNSHTHEGKEIYPLMVPLRELSLAFRRMYPNIESREEVRRMERERSTRNN